MTLALWARKHKAAAVLVGLVFLYLLYRWARGERLAGGHRTPEDAVAWGWMVAQAGITGWKEWDPATGKEYYHDTGWTGDPFQKG